MKSVKEIYLKSKIVLSLHLKFVKSGSSQSRVFVVFLGGEETMRLSSYKPGIGLVMSCVAVFCNMMPGIILHVQDIFYVSINGRKCSTPVM